MGKFIDMTGWVMSEHGVPDSKIIVRNKTDKRDSNNNVIWECDCACGTKGLMISSSSIRTGNTKSCGCLSGFVNLIGEKFSRLTVKARLENDKHGNAMWLCKCECGSDKEVVATSQSLKCEKVRSCGCLQDEARHKRVGNQYDITGDYGIGWTSNTNQEFYFDLEDYDTIKTYTWIENDQGYIISKMTDENYRIRMHRLILNCKKDDKIIIDHKNCKRYDNRKENLRYSNKQTNGINRDANKNNKLGIKGVYRLKNGHYQGKIQYFDKIYTKNSANLQEVIKWRQQKEQELYGEFSFYNHTRG